MKYAFVFFTVTAFLAFQATGDDDWKRVLIWPAVSFAMVGLAYAGCGPTIFGKQSDGSMSLLSIAILAPYLAYSWTIWHFLVWLQREAPYNELVPGILIGRRLRSREAPPHLASIVDLTCEFPESPTLRRCLEYQFFPILDGSTCDVVRLVEFVQHLDAQPRPIFVHCAQGHGRTGLIAATLLIKSRIVKTAEEAVELIQTRRPLVRLNAAQWSTLRSVSSLIGAEQDNAMTE